MKLVSRFILKLPSKIYIEEQGKWGLTLKVKVQIRMDAINHISKQKSCIQYNNPYEDYTEINPSSVTLENQSVNSNFDAFWKYPCLGERHLSVVFCQTFFFFLCKYYVKGVVSYDSSCYPKGNNPEHNSKGMPKNYICKCRSSSVFLN